MGKSSYSLVAIMILVFAQLICPARSSQLFFFVKKGCSDLLETVLKSVSSQNIHIYMYIYTFFADKMIMYNAWALPIWKKSFVQDIIRERVIRPPFHERSFHGGDKGNTQHGAAVKLCR